jgi:hypothetical protein
MTRTLAFMRPDLACAPSVFCPRVWREDAPAVSGVPRYGREHARLARRATHAHSM